MVSLICFAAAALTLVVRLAILVHLHRSRMHNPIRDAVSDYGVGETRRWFNSMGVAATAGWWLLALGTWFGEPDWSDRGFVTIALGVAGLTTFLMRFFPTDLPGQRRTLTGIVHYVLAILQFGLTFSAMGNVRRYLADPLASGLWWIAVVGLVGLCLCLIPPLRSRLGIMGLAERIFLVSVAAFYLDYAVLAIVRG